ncbi:MULTISPECIES: hypothetical protein [Klebsiella]|uniref:hypothetical protein n=1 Tax=Klebsiella TaxID=570 RepID=UPI0007D0BEFC|nr:MULTISPECIES: hypothetical protein [Klebsiella]PJR66285.1 hypothetical protein CWM61_06370 [Klebsiella sp. K-Nf6]SBN08778.1 conserved hypothetical protein [Klebsiella variicola]
MEFTERYNFTRFPYRRDVRENGDINNGGFDLIQFPEKINDIHEVNDFPWFKDFIVQVNSVDGLFMTLGCAIGYEEEILYGYIDFSLRPNTPITIKNKLINLDEHFYEYLSQAIPHEESRLKAIQYTQHHFLWLASPLEIYGEEYSKVNLTFREKNQSGLAWAFDHLSYFLTKHYPSKL